LIPVARRVAAGLALAAAILLTVPPARRLPIRVPAPAYRTLPDTKLRKPITDNRFSLSAERSACYSS